jgi:uncharacterized Zn finger protein
MSESSNLTKPLTLANVLSLADTKTFERGKAYFHDCAVSRLAEHAGTVRASVRGTHNARYEQAFEVVSAIGRLRAQLAERAEFASELENIRTTYRAKRNFIKLLATLS